MVRINSLKKVSLILSLALVGMACTTTPKNTEETMESLTQYVEPRIGTAHCRWFHFAPGAMPFGLAKPAAGDLKTIPGPLNSIGQGYRSSFDHKDEIATAGYYSVMLKDYNVKAELTATPRVAFQRFTFHKSDASHILFDIGNRQGESGPAVDAFVRIKGND